jgi:biotin transport system substrate-specific component
MTGKVPYSILTGRGEEAMVESRARYVAFVGLLAAITAVGAQIQTPLPFSPVPVVLSNFFSILAGLVAGPRLGAASQIVYLMLGASGVPVFAGFHGGFHVLAGPTGGYLIGFILAAAAAGLLTGPAADTRRTVIAAAIAAALIYIPGVPWLMATTGMEFRRALAVGVLPFLPGDAVKVIVAGVVAPKLVQAVRIRPSGSEPSSGRPYLM